MAITNEQLAELILGIARSQKAIVDAIAQHMGTNGMAFRGVLIPTLQGAAHLQNPQQEPTLLDLPSRILLHVQGGSAQNPNAQPYGDWVREQLDRLIQ